MTSGKAQQHLEAVILAGGLGTRLRGVVPDIPKPMAPVEGRPFLEHQLDYWIDQGVTRFVLSLGYRPEAFVQHFGNAYRGAEIAYSVESQPLGTGGGVLLATAQLKGQGAFLVLNGDTLGDVDLAGVMRRHRDASAAMTLALIRMSVGGRFSSVNVDASGRVVEFRDSDDAPRPLVNAGVYVVERPFLASLGWSAGERFSIESEGFPRMLQRREELFGYEALTRFLDIGVPEDYYRAGEFIHNLRQK